MGSFSETSDEKLGHVPIDSKQLDTGAQLDASLHTQLDPGESLRIRWKIDRHILPLMCILYWYRPLQVSFYYSLLIVFYCSIQFMDKATLGSASILGILKATHLTANQYNWLGTIFYLGYLAFVIPQNLALQRFPVGKWMSLNIFIWGVALCCHAACKNFAGLFAARFVLGICEGSITAGFMIVSSMFYTRREHTARVGYWFLMNGTGLEFKFFYRLPTLMDVAAQIISGFISFGTLHIHTKGFEPWQWLMIITGTLTLITAVSFFFLFPDSPTNAWFLTEDERAKAVRRIKENQTGVENKHFKKEQMIEAFTDPKTWLFALFAAFNNVPNSLTNQIQIIIVSFGFNPIQTTLLGCVSGVVEIVTIFTGVTIASRIPNSIAWVGIGCFIPSFLGLFLVNFLPWHDKVGLLFSLWLTITWITSLVLSLTWLSQTTAGHTKRVTTNAIMLSAYCIGNAAGPFMWRAKYKPRNHVPWIIIGVCYLSCIVLLFSIRVLLARENRLRDAEPPDDSFNDVYVVRIDEDGSRNEVKVSKEFLDLTDGQNRDFRYVL
ncbi:MFS general substrate transporter [Russula ochroleuca]|uniref:MFS general substrate transporter n=1 Tax=Russula ochroleuca TaxID=152965 RepID=A0A9P5MWJ0_9AGAM|nr:MFS general substrate transporter [Russula ochroleuca]